MRYQTKQYSLEIPDNLVGVMGYSKKGNNVVIRLLWEDGMEHSGILTTLKLLKRIPKNMENREMIGVLRNEEGTQWHLIAFYGEEDSCSEENEDLYWRLMDRLFLIYQSIAPASGYFWQRTGD